MSETLITRKSLYSFENQQRKVECWVDNCGHLSPDAIVIGGYIEDEQCRQDYNRFLHNLWVQEQSLKKLYRVLHVPEGAKEELLETIAHAFRGRQARFAFQEFLHQNKISYFCSSNWHWGEDIDVNNRPRMRYPASSLLFDYTKGQFRHSAQCFIDDGLQVIGIDTRMDQQDKWCSFLLEVECSALPELYKVLGVSEGSKEQLVQTLVHRFQRVNGWYFLQEFLMRQKIPHGVYCYGNDEG